MSVCADSDVRKGRGGPLVIDIAHQPDRTADVSSRDLGISPRGEGCGAYGGTVPVVPTVLIVQ